MHPVALLALAAMLALGAGALAQRADRETYAACAAKGGIAIHVPGGVQCARGVELVSRL